MERWKKAQESEKAFWEESFKDEPAFRKMCMRFYPIYKNFLKDNMIDTSKMDILDCGSGAYSALVSIKAKKKYAMDPLMDYFKTKVPESFYKDNKIITLSERGEDIKKGSDYDMILCLNTLDHADNPEQLIQAVNGGLKPEGYLLVSVNHYDWPIVLFRRFCESIKVGDACHPHTYHLDDITEMLDKNGFRIINARLGDVNESKKQISEAGGTVKTSFYQRFEKAVKNNGLFYAVAHSLVAPFHIILNSVFTTYPDSLFLCQKRNRNKEKKDI